MSAVTQVRAFDLSADLKATLQRFEVYADQARADRGPTPGEQKLVEKRQLSRDWLKNLGFDFDLAPDVAAEDKILSEVFSSLGLDASQVKNLPAEKRQEILNLVKLYYATGLDAENGSKLVSKDLSHDDVVSQLVQSVSSLASKTGLNNDQRTQLISRLDRNYQENPKVNYFGLQADAVSVSVSKSNTATLSVSRLTAPISNFANSILDFATDQQIQAEPVARNLDATGRNDDTRIKADSSVQPASVQAPAVVVTPVLQITPSDANADSSSNDSSNVSKPLTFDLKSHVQAPLRATENSSIISHEISQAEPVRNLAASSAHDSSADGAAKAAESIAAQSEVSAAKAAGAEDSAVVGGIATTSEHADGKAVSSLLERAIAKIEPYTSGVLSYYDKLKSKAKGMLARYVPGFDDSSAKPAAQAITSAPANSDHDDKKLAADLLPEAHDAGMARDVDCKSPEADFLRIHQKTSVQLGSIDVPALSSALRQVIGSDGSLSSETWKSTFDVALSNGSKASPSIDTYHDAFQHIWMEDVNSRLALRACSDTENAQYRQVVLALAGSEAPVTSDSKQSSANREPASVEKGKNVETQTVASKQKVDALAGQNAIKNAHESVNTLNPSQVHLTVNLTSQMGSDKSCYSKAAKEGSSSLAFNTLGCRSQFRDRFVNFDNGSESFKADDYRRCLGNRSNEDQSLRLGRLQAVLFSQNSECFFEGAHADPERPELMSAQLDVRSCASFNSIKEPEAEDKARIATLNSYVDEVASHAKSSSEAYQIFKDKLSTSGLAPLFMKNLTSCTEGNQWGNYVLAVEKSLRNAAAQACGSTEAFVVSKTLEKDRSQSEFDSYFSASPDRRQELYTSLSKGAVAIGKGHFDDDRRSTLLFDSMFRVGNQIAKSDCTTVVTRYQLYLGLILNSDLKRNWLSSMPGQDGAGSSHHVASSR